MGEALKARVRDADGEPEGALVLLHGRGADEHDLVALLELLDPERRLLGITPRAPLSLPPGGAHWYVVPRVGYPDPETFRASYKLVASWLDGLGVPHDRIVLGGFSQGAVMSYALALGRGRPRPGAVIALSGFIPTVEGWELDTSEGLPPVAIGHGTFDDVIAVDFARKARALLETAGAPVLYRESSMGHSIDPRFAAEVRVWMSDIVGVGVH